MRIKNKKTESRFVLPGVRSGTCALRSLYRVGDRPVEKTSKESWAYLACQRALKRSKDVFSGS